MQTFVLSEIIDKFQSQKSVSLTLMNSKGNFLIFNKSALKIFD
jgi:hypothetical protein